jgi:hypothetical protein
MPIYIEHLIAELLRAHGGKLVSVMEPEIRAIVQAAIDQERERAKEQAEALKTLLWVINHDLAWSFNQPYIKRVEAAIDKAVAALRRLP